MKDIVIFSCTNRVNSNTLRVSRIYGQILQAQQVGVKILDFCNLPRDIVFSEVFGNHSPDYLKLIEEYVSKADKFVFVIPEYNGSFPGILKVFLESVHPDLWADKDAMLVGVANGRAGNLRGLEHLTGILGYLKMHVYHDKLPISNIGQFMTIDGAFSSDEQMKACTRQVAGFLTF